MGQTQQILIVENRREWRSILDQLEHDADNVLDAVQTYGEALAALEKNTFDLAIIDLTLRSTEHDYDNDGTHDGLQVLAELAQRFPATKLVILGEGLSRETLRNTPGIPDTINLISH